MGALNAYTVIELAGLGPCPMAGMILADMGATVIRIERPTANSQVNTRDASARGKKSMVLDLKSEQGKQVLLELVKKSDVLIEGYRPGVTEKLGIGPEACHAVNPKLIYGRVTGWGQDGPLSQAAGHDINYTALSGALFAIGNKDEKPVLPLNLIGDMGGGGMLLVNGVLAALLETAKSGKGQVVDAAMVDGAAQLMWMMHGFAAEGSWNAKQRGSNLLDGGAHFYDTYETRDGEYIAIGSIEPQFYALLIELAGLDKERFSDQHNQSLWPELKEELRKLFKSKSRKEWCEIMEGTDVCFAPVLSMSETHKHPHNKFRNTFIEVDEFIQAAPAPRFSRTPSTVRHGKHQVGEDSVSVLKEMGFEQEQIEQLMENGVLQEEVKDGK